MYLVNAISSCTPTSIPFRESGNIGATLAQRFVLLLALMIPIESVRRLLVKSEGEAERVPRALLVVAHSQCLAVENMQDAECIVGIKLGRVSPQPLNP